MTQRIRVLHVLYELRSSGAEMMLYNAAPYWNEKGVDLHVLSTAPIKGGFADDLSSKGIIIHHIPHSSSLDFLCKFYNLVKKSRFDVVQIHIEKTFLTFSAVARFAGVPVIIRTIHSTFIFKGLTKIFRSIRRLFARALGVIQVSVSVAVQENEQVQFRNPTLQINNWFNDSIYYPPSESERSEARNRFDLNNKIKIILSIGNCAPVKNHELIIRSLPYLKGNNSLVEYWHIGEEDHDKLEQRIVNDLGLNSIVRFWGKLNDLRDFLWAADIFIMPSLYEGFGIATLEAIATGIPVILTKAPGLHQWTETFPDIFLTELDTTNMSATITKVLAEKHARRNVDRNYLSINFGIEQGAEKYFRLYCKKATI